MAFKLPDLEYNYNILEPYIDAKTMEIHYSKHHQGYVNNLNSTLEGSKYENYSIEELLKEISNLPDKIKVAVQNNGGGHFNHSLFWKILKKDEETAPVGLLSGTINKTYGSFENFKNNFSKTALTRFGSGWAWVVVNSNENLEIYSTANQDSPLSNGDTPIMALDVWEHAYYLNYQNKRAEYIENFFKIINWKQVNTNYTEAIK